MIFTLPEKVFQWWLAYFAGHGVNVEVAKQWFWFFILWTVFVIWFSSWLRKLWTKFKHAVRF